LDSSLSYHVCKHKPGMKRTVFYETHRRAGARMVEFAGYEMPVEYTGIIDEHLTVREKAGIFDVSHMGEIWVKGKEARDFVQKMTTNDVDRLSPGKVQYSCFPNGTGGIVDDLLVYMYEGLELAER
jgi:aminomethyltransferase